MNNKQVFALFRKIHIEEGAACEVLITERWRLMRPFHGMNNKTKLELTELIRRYVQKFR